MKLFLQILLIVSSVLLVVAVLLHRGRGGGLSSLFGGGMQSSLSGSSVAEKNLDRITLLLGAIWLISIVGLAIGIWAVLTLALLLRDGDRPVGPFAAEHATDPVARREADDAVAARSGACDEVVLETLVYRPFDEDPRAAEAYFTLIRE